MDLFWRHLAAGRSLITELSSQRWDVESKAGENNRIWGGFLDDAQAFDAAFFGISPKEAAWMDPQQRFALEMAWHAIEDAGLQARTLAGSRTGVYMGVCHWDYAELLEKHLAHVDAYMPTGIAFSIIANRISHFFDFQGPSITNDTACAASMTSVYEAVRALQSGECELALAGGVNMIWSPNHFEAFSKAGMLSKVGRSQAFDAGADGYVRGEGGAVLLLKPLSRAQADGDNIQAVIRGIGINHGGRTNSLTVTNPRAQSDLIQSIYQAAGASPDSIDFIEAHGPGTPLGDPIEIAGLKQAFAALHENAGTQPQQNTCGIGSVKTNIGHLEGAAGVAGIVKVLAALRYEKWPANVGFETLNSLIDFANSPFRIQKEASPWAKGKKPRRAGVSSFGFGGSNAHVLLEGFDEYHYDDAGTSVLPVIVPLSARDENRLLAYVVSVLDFVKGDGLAAGQLADLAYTYQCGREDMDARVAFVVNDVEALIEALSAFAQGQTHAAVIHNGIAPNEGGEIPTVWATRWVAGEAVDWMQLNPEKNVRRISVPPYPFARDIYWMDLSWNVKDVRPISHPLLHGNVSGFEKVAFQTTLTGTEFVWADHHVGDDQVLPGMVYLEMVRAAVALADDSLEFAEQGFHFEDIVWVRPIRAQGSPVTLTTRIKRGQDERIAFSIEHLDQDDFTTTIVQGSLRQGDQSQPARVMLDALRGTLTQKVKAASCYERLRTSGVHHGPTFQVLKSIQCSDDEVLASLKLSRRFHPTLDSLALHPILLDGAIQAWIALQTGDAKEQMGAAVPFACERIDVYGPCEAAMWAVVRPTQGAQNGPRVQHLDIELCDQDGTVRVAFHNLVLRGMATKDMPASIENKTAKEHDPGPLVIAEGVWESCILEPKTSPSSSAQASVLAACLEEPLAQNLAEALAWPLHHLPDMNGGDEAKTAESWFAFLHAHIVSLLKEDTAESYKVLVVAPQSLAAYLIEPLAALLRTATLENPKISGSVLCIDDDIDALRWTDIVDAESRSGEGFTHIRYDKDVRRSVWRPRRVSLPTTTHSLSVNPDGVYWITGGIGGLGIHFADWLISLGAQRVVLSGRRKVLSSGDKAAVKALTTSNVTVHYRACDVADATDVVACVSWIADEVGALKGIIHAAGVLQDGYILTQSQQAIAKVFAPKVAGVFNLDAATADLDLAFMVLCSSIATPFGNVGQAAYGGANAFLDAFADQRSQWVKDGQRQGRTVAIGWPLWADGGMHVDASTLSAMEQRWGITPLPTAVGIDVLERILNTGSQARYTVFHGHVGRINELLATYGAEVSLGADRSVSGSASRSEMDGDDKDLRKGVVNYLREVLAEVLHLEPDRIRANRTLDEYGLDSISIVETTNRLEEVFGPLSKTLFFEYVDLNGVAGHLLKSHRAILVSLIMDEKGASLSAPSEQKGRVEALAVPTLKVVGPSDKQENHDVAVIGLSMRVAKAMDQETFWDMLAEGIDGFEPYPQSRWDHAALLHSERDVLGKTVVKTGAFLADVDKFDPRYFRISQAEAELMSPEVRLFLEASVEAFEDAGYSREQMQKRYDADVAVIVGSMTNEYHLYGFQNMLVRGSKASGSYTGTVPNMVSYYYGFTGPSYFLDTMCSASSTCVHEAVHMLRAGRCKMALAGGVSLLLHPQKLIATSQEHFTTKTADVIRGYGVGADGTILGEGVGALVLKTLADAKRDGDHIYGVIKGSGISNAGVRNGFTVPNPNQQAVAIERALEDADVEASSIGYVEGHGSGTALGDPIEVTALTRVFGAEGVALQSCPLGTVKSNVAHLLGASGLAGMVKVLMQMKHGELVPSLHAETLNPDIPFKQTPFYIQRTREPWLRKRDQTGRELPRRAGVTSIGAGGMNSHIIFEEYQHAPLHPVSPASMEAQLLVFSAMNERALVAVVERFCNFIKNNLDAVLADVAYTLQVGKNELPCRLTLIVSDWSAVLSRLKDFLAVRETQDGVNYIRSILDQDPPDEDAPLCDAIAGRDLEMVAKAWAEGTNIDWDILHHEQDVRRVSLPAYPFERVRCWYRDEPDVPSVINPLGSKLKLHPFVGANQSDLSGLKYVTKIHLQEMQDYLFMTDRKSSILPIVPIEIAVALARIAGLRGEITLHDLAVENALNWSRVRELTCRVEVVADGGLRVSLETVGDDALARPWARARVSSTAALDATEQRLDLSALRAGAMDALDHTAFYRHLSDQGYGFGPYLESVDHACRLADGALLCTLRQDPPQQDGFMRNLQVPAFALAAAYQLLEWAQPGWIKATPWSLKEATFVTGKIAHVHLMPQGEGCFEITFLSPDGGVISRWKGMADKPLTATPALPLGQQPIQIVQNAAAYVLPSDDEVIQTLRQVAGKILQFSPEDIGLREPFHDLGFDSVSLTRYAHELGTLFEIELSPALFFECEHIEALSDYLIEHHGVALNARGDAAVQAFPEISVAPVEHGTEQKSRSDAVAIIGMAGRFPGSADIETFFDRLLDGDDLIGDLPLARYDGDDLARIEQSDFIKRGGFLSDIDRFDAGHFKISPLEAERMDPQQRVLLETVWHALDHAGYHAEELPQETGVFVGVSNLDYADLLRAHGVRRDSYVATGNSLAMVANRVSHALNLRGPSLSVDTACSSSLIALLQAVQAIQNGRCESALVGGVNLCLSPEGFEGPHDAGMLSPTGRCQSFGREADGYVRGEGVVALLIKPLSAAKRDGDRVLGVVLGGAQNHGGRSGSLTAPSAKAQAGLIRHAMAGIDPYSISYIEAHGTGTPLGDPVEVNGLKLAYAELMDHQSVETPFINLGSVKSNIGHLEAAAGLAGVVKVLMAMQREELPPTLHCQDANPHFDLRNTPFRLVRARTPWGQRQDVSGKKMPRRAAVSSFGFGGANAHVILEQAPAYYTPHRSARILNAFAPTRFWLPQSEGKSKGVGTAVTDVVKLIPNWVEMPLGDGPMYTLDQRLVVPCELSVAPGQGARIEAVAVGGGDIGTRYGVMAQHVLSLVQGVLRGSGHNRVLIQLVVPQGDGEPDERELYAGLAGMLETVHLETPRIQGQVIEVSAKLNPDELADVLAVEARAIHKRVRYRQGHRYVQRWTPYSFNGENQKVCGGVTLITGGMGGLGRHVARAIANQETVRVLVLVGTSPLDSERSGFIEDLHRFGARAEYHQVDIADDVATDALVQGIVQRYGVLNAVIHCAGCLRDGLVQNKTAQDLTTVLAAKVSGALALRKACQGMDLDAFVMFSSLAGVVGNAGQADYAAANGFLDALAAHNSNNLISINWPLWCDGGMQMDKAGEDELYLQMGQRPLETEDGLEVLFQAMGAGLNQLAIVGGERARIVDFFACRFRVESLVKPLALLDQETAVGDEPLVDEARLRADTTAALGKLFARVGGFAAEDIVAQTPLDEYGIDSLMITRLNAELDTIFGPLPKTLFFQYRTLSEMVNYLLLEQEQCCRCWVGLDRVSPLLGTTQRPSYEMSSTNDTAPVEPIAVVGISGHYPGGDDLGALWDTLMSDRDVVSEIPQERWPLEGFYHGDRDEAIERGMSYAKWGAFLDGFADFDPLFFKISPRDAAAMDPQERLFLMSAWAAFEDAGYSPKRLKAITGGEVGVFAGVTKTGFALHGPFVSNEGAMIRPMTSFASVANRVSHALDLSGPSLPVDTMCSSSLTAIHEACLYLRSTKGAMALAGGVNLYLHPSNYVDLCTSQMLSPDGRCKSFGAEADGFVPGEGVGCVVLKPLSRALADGDRIHAVIRGSAVNHGGRSNGYAVPSPAAQRDVVRAALAQAGVKAEEISCIEAHGTGTELGDPIEVEGLSQAFQVDTDKHEFCALGSIKSVLGHLEAAAGIAGLSKVILQMKHETLAPTRHVAQTNPNIDFSTTPFTVQRSAAPWPASQPRIAGISSFGAGGANAHVIVSAWFEDEVAATAQANDTSTPLQAVTLSARDPERLRLQAERLLAFLKRQTQDRDGAHAVSSLPRVTKIEDVAHTLQIGREAMAWRLGLAVNSIAALMEGLHNWLSGDSESSVLYVGQQSATRPGPVTELIGDEVLEELVERHVRQGRLDTVLKLWVEGVEVDWAALPKTGSAQIVSLPNYPFARHRYWLPQCDDAPSLTGVVNQVGKDQGNAALLGASQLLEKHLAALLNAILSNRSDTMVIPDLQHWYDAACDALTFCAEEPPRSLDETWADWQAYGRQTPENQAQRNLAEMTLRGLSDILVGRKQATDVLFPNGSLEAVEAVYKDNPTAARFSQTLAAAAAAFVGDRLRHVPDQGLRILEIGAGTGGTSEAVFEALGPYAENVGEYCYSDVSRAFLIHAQRHYEQRVPYLTTALFNVEMPLADQDIEPGAYDLVIAANVLHATADIDRTLAIVRETLAPGGLLLINETSMATIFTHVTFGLLEGWWRFTDPDRRIAGTPSLSADSWRQAMEASGLTWVVGSSTAETALGQQILAAQVVGRKLDDCKTQSTAAMLPPPVHEDTAKVMQTGSLRDALLDALAQTLNISVARIGIDQAFADLGLDSILGAEWVRRLRRRLDIDLDQTRLFDFANVVQLERFLLETYPDILAAASPSLGRASEKNKPAVQACQSGAKEPIAIVGMSGRFAGSENIDELWTHLVAGDDLVKPVSRFNLAPYYTDAEPGSYGRHGSFIEEIERFDPVFFGISGIEATYMDPQQRLFLEEAWKTLEQAGHGGEDMIGRRCGVFVGCSHGDYQNLFQGDPPGQAFWGNTSSLIPARISYWLDLKGPAVAVDTACSSSLVAIHLACQSLWSGESEMALAGGVFIQSSPRFFRSANQAQMLSARGRCAAFGEGADGIVPGEAVAAVLLRPLSQALADGDTIHGVIIGSATNQDGATNGITAPSGLSQESLIRKVHQDFAIDPASIGMIEAHGTGTPLGDPIEYAALNRVFQSAENVPSTCFLGSIKSNIGHATTAAGVSGLMRVLLSLKHAQVPPTLHVATANPAIAVDQGPFVLNSEVMEWPAHDGRPRRAGINAFGFSGTNAHVVVEESPVQPKNPHMASAYLFVLSARTVDELRQQAQRMLEHLAQNPDQVDEDIAFTLFVGRRHLHHRLSVVAAGADEFAQRLRGWLEGQALAGLEQSEVDLRDHREDTEQTASGSTLLDALAAGMDSDNKASLSTQLMQLSAFYRQGCRLPFKKMFSPTVRRVPLPRYPLAGKRYWVEDAPQEILDESTRIVLSNPAQPLKAAAYIPATTTPRISLAALVPEPAIREVAASLHAETQNGVRILRLAGAFGPQSAQALHHALDAADQDETVGAVLVLGDQAWSGGADHSIDAQLIRTPWTCALPVVAGLTASASGPGVAMALAADFVVLAKDLTISACEMGADDQGIYDRRLGHTAGQNFFTTTLKSQGSGMRIVAAEQVETCALELAKQLVQAPRDAAIVLKRHMRHAMPTFAADQSGMETELHVLACADAPQPAVGTAQSLALKTPVMKLELYDNGVVVLLLNEQSGRNTFTPAFMGGIEEAFAVIAATPQAKVVVMTGYDGYFACGGTADGLKKLQTGATRFTDRKIYSLPISCELPVIAAMQGHAIGAGWSLGMFCDLALFATEGVYHSNYMWYGFTPGAGATIAFPFRLGDDLGREVLFSAHEYRGCDLLGRAPGLTVVPAVDVLPRAIEMAHTLAVQPRQKLVTAKAQANKSIKTHLDMVLSQEMEMHEKTFIGNARVRARIEEKFAGTDSAQTQLAPNQDVTVQDVRTLQSQVREQMVAALAEDLMIDMQDIRDDAGFLDLGLDSILAVTWIRRLNALFDVELPATSVYAHPTFGSMVAHVADLLPEQDPPQISPVHSVQSPPLVMSQDAPSPRVEEPEPIGAVAIIGASGRFPQADNLAAFWDNIRAGKDCIEEVPIERWDVKQFYHPDPQNSGTSYCKWMGRMDDVDRFDPEFFNITPREAELMDPQQRLFLEHAWHAIEDAACDPLSLAGRQCGVYTASGPSGYSELIQERNAYSLSGNSGSILAARISYFLDLRGPCLSIDTACSSSLVAISEACDNLLAKRCDMALAGGVSVLLGPDMFIDASKVSMLSKSGRCFTFDQRADGFVPGEGIGVVVLKRLQDAVRDGDPIRAVIRGWGINQDGRTNGITAPNPQAQTDLMQDIYRRFDIDPASIDLVECHGTGTPLGDPIEIEGLTNAFAETQRRAQPCAIGSVKSNVGHLLAAAGVAGALKAMLSLEQRQQPPNVHFETCNSHITLETTPFAVNTSLQEWPQPKGHARRAAVSSFGFSGTNAHLILEEAVSAPPSRSSTGPWLFTLSALSTERLRTHTARIEQLIRAQDGLNLADLAYTLQVGRCDFSHRLAFVSADRDEVLQALASVTAGSSTAESLEGVFMFGPDPERTSLFEADDDMAVLTGKWLGSGQRDKLSKLAEMWSRGASVDWSNTPVARRIRIPGYPFAEERFWVAPQATPKIAQESAVTNLASPEPLVDGQDKSDLVVRVPVTSQGLSLLELARAAMERVQGQPVRGLKHLLWGDPVDLNSNAQDMNILISSDRQGFLYRVASKGAKETPYHLAEQIGEHEKTLRPDDFAPDQFFTNLDVSADFMDFHRLCGAVNGSVQVQAVYRDAEILTARLERVSNHNGAGEEGVFDVHYLAMVGLLAAFRDNVQSQDDEQQRALLPSSMGSMISYELLKDAAWLRMWTRPDGSGSQPMTVIFYGDDGRARLALNDLHLVPEGQAQAIRLNG